MYCVKKCKLVLLMKPSPMSLPKWPSRGQLGQLLRVGTFIQGAASPALVGEVLTTEPPGKSQDCKFSELFPLPLYLPCISLGGISFYY